MIMMVRNLFFERALIDRLDRFGFIIEVGRRLDDDETFMLLAKVH
jgi:hypothetical protein